ncbi:hypothetical protein FACS189475_00440 [Betaproteobacteria bacterium]|nr:hypothetical protein FACS189475_00440 [Betaproteobacteria bacterium]
MLKIYLDNCCYNRPFDDLRDMQVRAEADSKRFTQSLMSYGVVQLVYSFISLYEIRNIRLEDVDKKESILAFIDSVPRKIYVSGANKRRIEEISREIMATGVKYADATHTACAIVANCDYLLTTDKRLLKYQTDRIKLISPINFEHIWRRENA